MGNNTKKLVSRTKNISTSKKKRPMLHKLVYSCRNLSKLVQTCPNLSSEHGSELFASVLEQFIQNDQCFLIFIKTLSTCCFSTCTLILLKKSSSKTTKQNKSYYSSLHSIPPSSQTTLMLLYTYFFQNLNFLFAFLI